MPGKYFLHGNLEHHSSTPCTGWCNGEGRLGCIYRYKEQIAQGKLMGTNCQRVKPAAVFMEISRISLLSWQLSRLLCTVLKYVHTPVVLKLVPYLAWSQTMPSLPKAMRKKQISGRKEGRIDPQGCSALGRGPVAWRNHRAPEYSCFKFWTTNECAHLVNTPSQRTSLVGLNVGFFLCMLNNFFLFI